MSRFTQRPQDPLTPRQMAIAGAVVGVLYAIGMIARGEIAPGLVGGVLAAVLMFLVLRQTGNRRRERIERWERRHGGGS